MLHRKYAHLNMLKPKMVERQETGKTNAKPQNTLE